MWGCLDCDLAEQMRDAYLLAGGEHQLVEDPQQADIILFWDPHQTTEVIAAPRLRSHPLVRDYPEKTFVVSSEDYPIGFLPGLYCSLTRRLFDPRRHRTWFYHRTPNPDCFTVSREKRNRTPRHLASFVGANSHEVRQRLLGLSESVSPYGIELRETVRARFNPKPAGEELADGRSSYIDSILNARFNLCPRGNGVASYRLQETLALGRAPVIISDDWVPVRGLEWKHFAIFVPERELAELPRILLSHEPRWREMGAAAREVYLSLFAHGQFVTNAVREIVAIFQNRKHREIDFVARWPEMLAGELRRGVVI